MSRLVEHPRGFWERRAPWVRVVVSMVGVLVAFYSVPVEWSGSRAVGPVLLTLLGVGALSWVIVGQARRHFSGEQEVRLPMLVTLMPLVMAVFALGYYALETARPGQMADLSTRTDALYFTLQVLTTVGLGDVHAVGQAARALVSAQMAFDLVFVAAGGSLLAGAVRSRVAENLAASRTAPSTQGIPPTEEQHDRDA